MCCRSVRRKLAFWFFLLLLLLSRASSWIVHPRPLLRPHPYPHASASSSSTTAVWSSDMDDSSLTAAAAKKAAGGGDDNEEGEDDDEKEIRRTTFDQAGKSLIDEEDQKRLEQMGDFDANPASDVDSMERMRAAIRDRAASMGLEKSKVSAEYIKAKQQQAEAAGSARAADQQTSGDVFGGLDLSLISPTKDSSSRSSSQSIWADADGEVPSMFYEPEEELSPEERAEIDPVSAQNYIQQTVHELSNSKWPDLLSALREVGLMIVIVLVTAALVIGWDNFLRGIYTDLGFIPTKEEIMNYADRFSGLDLPKGWTDNMSEQDVAQFAEKVSQQQMSSPAGGTLPDL